MAVAEAELKKASGRQAHSIEEVELRAIAKLTNVLTRASMLQMRELLARVLLAWRHHVLVRKVSTNGKIPAPTQLMHIAPMD